MNTTNRRFRKALATVMLTAAPTVALANMVNLPGPGPVAMAGAAGSAIPAMPLGMAGAAPLLVTPGVVAAALVLAIAVLAGLELGHLMRTVPHGARGPAGAR